MRSSLESETLKSARSFFGVLPLFFLQPFSRNGSLGLKTRSLHVSSPPIDLLVCRFGHLLTEHLKSLIELFLMLLTLDFARQAISTRHNEKRQKRRN